MSTDLTSKKFMLDDFARTLFPLKTNQVLLEMGDSEIADYLAKCLDPDIAGISFLPQQKVHATKSGLHLRRTLKLDVVAEFFIYDFSYRNRSKFRKPYKESRSSFGYRFSDGSPLNSSNTYSEFKSCIAKNIAKYEYFIAFDIAAYFNHVYHHDLVIWARDARFSDEDVSSLNQYLREINSGRSVDCLPQGLYPTKMIGNDYLKFVDNHYKIRSEVLLRFMDDFYIFSNDMDKVRADFVFIQELLGDKGLYVNPSKTNDGISGHVGLDNEIDEMKKKLLHRRRHIISASYDDEEDVFMDFAQDLSDDELEYVVGILSSGHLEEEDAELILTIMRNNSEKVESQIGYIFASFPNLAKSIYMFCKHIDDKEKVAGIVLEALSGDSHLQEYQLFWLGVMLEEYLLDASAASEIIAKLIDHPDATVVSRAKILEIKDRRFGLQDIRNAYLRSGQSDWLSWSSAVGSLAISRGSRQHTIDYFRKSSPMNNLIGSIISKA